MFDRSGNMLVGKQVAFQEDAVLLLECPGSRMGDRLGGHRGVLETTYRRLCAGVPSVILAK
jgi:hypothetical protein